MFTYILLSLSLAAASAPDPLQSLLRELDAKRCDEAFALVSQVKVPEKPGLEAAAAAKALTRGAAACNAEPALSLAFVELAAKLAPGDTAAQLARAQFLNNLGQRLEAAEVLDQLLVSHPKDLPQARLLRGQLAASEGAHQLVLRTLEPLASDPKYKAEVEPLLAASRQALKESAARESARPTPPSSEARVPPLESGRVVASFDGTLSLGADRTFNARGLRKGTSYVFRASGQCSREDRVIMVDTNVAIRRERKESIFGIDFAVQFGTHDPRQLSAGQYQQDFNQIEFIADAEEMPIRVFDRSTVDRGVVCTLTGFTVAVR
jgi:tetratricopeptide (TPR) repeat protein